MKYTKPGPCEHFDVEADKPFKIHTKKSCKWLRHLWCEHGYGFAFKMLLINMIVTGLFVYIVFFLSITKENAICIKNHWQLWQEPIKVPCSEKKGGQQ